MFLNLTCFPGSLRKKDKYKRMRPEAASRLTTLGDNTPVRHLKAGKVSPFNGNLLVQYICYFPDLGNVSAFCALMRVILSYQLCRRHLPHFHRGWRPQPPSDRLHRVHAQPHLPGERHQVAAHHQEVPRSQGRRPRRLRRRQPRRGGRAARSHQSSDSAGAVFGGYVQRWRRAGLQNIIKSYSCVVILVFLENFFLTIRVRTHKYRTGYITTVILNEYRCIYRYVTFM